MIKIAPVLLIIAVVLLSIITLWIGCNFHRWRQQEKLKEKQAASRPINAWWSYNCKGEIKQQGHELRRMSWEEVKKGGEKEKCQK